MTYFANRRSLKYGHRIFVFKSSEPALFISKGVNFCVRERYLYPKLRNPNQEKNGLTNPVDGILITKLTPSFSV